jgi:putative oxidoreductase
MFAKLSKLRAVLLACRLILGGVFLYAGAIKAISSAEFALALLPFTFVPETWLGFIAQALPLVEIAAGLLVVLPWTARWGAGLVLVLCLAFMTALGWALANDIIVACSCFGNDEEPSRGAMIFALVRDVVLAGMAGAVLIAHPGTHSLPPAQNDI